jgi:hypothetical protein
VFRRLPPQGGSPREVSEILNFILNGKTNNTGTVALATGNATTTSLIDERISVDTKIVILPFSSAAFADACALTVSLRTSNRPNSSEYGNLCACRVGHHRAVVWRISK